MNQPYRDEIQHLAAQLKQERRNRQLVSRQLTIAILALRWYGDEDGSRTSDAIDGVLVRDYGERAREALARINALEER